MEFRQRILRGVFSSLASRGLSIASQLITIPVLARGWGVETYGQYLTILAVAGFIPIATLGVHQAVLSEMSIAHAQKDSKAYGELLRGLFQLVLAISLGCVLVLAVASLAPGWLGLTAAAHGRAYPLGQTLFFVGLQLVALQIFGVFTNGIAALGSYGEAQLLDTARVGLDSLALWAGVLLLHWAPDHTAMVSAGVAFAFVAFAWLRLRSLSGEAGHLFGPANWRGLFGLWRAVVGNFAVTTGYNTLLIQGPRLVLAAFSGPTSVATFSIVWAMLGICRQAFEVFIHPLAVEFAYAYGARQRDRAEQLVAMGTSAATLPTLLAGPVLLTLGPWVVSVATKGQLHPPLLLMGIMWAVLLAYALSLAAHTALLASNQSHSAIFRFAIWSGAASALTVLLASQAGLIGVASGLLIFQLGFSAIVVQTATRVFDLDLARLMRRIFSLETPHMLLQLVRGVVGRA